jgi:hypothetical protein
MLSHKAKLSSQTHAFEPETSNFANPLTLVNRLMKCYHVHSAQVGGLRDPQFVVHNVSDDHGPGPVTIVT